MIISRLKIVIYSHLFFLVLLLSGLFSPHCLAGESIAPKKNIAMVQGDLESPQWKILWDKARGFVRNSDYLSAIKAYAELYRLKPNIEEAHWEYCKVLLQVGDFTTAGKIIGGLLDKDPNNSEYLLAGGDIALHFENYRTATEYYGRVLEKDPGGAQADAALLGLATSLRRQGKKELAFGLFEQYSLRHPENSHVLHTLAVDAHELGKDDKARKLYTRLLENPRVDDQVIFQAVKVFDVPGYEKKRGELWREYLIRHPDYMPFRQNLAQYYLDDGSYEAALLQLKYLAANNENNDVFLLAAARVCEEDLHRSDRALFFYEKYLDKHPGDAEITRKIAEIHTILAENLLAVVKKEGAEQLWDRLGDITPDRAPIFMEMADLLEEKGKNDQLLDVLTTLYKNTRPQDDIALRIARQYYDKGQYKKALDYLSAVTDPDNKTKSYFLIQGNSELHLGLEMKALGSFERAITRDPADLALRTKALDLAGKMGDGEALQAIFAGAKQQSGENGLRDLVFVYLDLLTYNFLFKEYSETSDWAHKRFADSQETITRLGMHRAVSLRREGKTKRAEQLLRQLLLQDILIEDILFQLTQNAALDKNTAAARSWYQELQKRSPHPDNIFSYDPQGARLLLLQLDILQAEGKYGQGRQLIDTYKTAAAQSPQRRKLLPFLVRLEKKSCWLSYLEGEVDEAYRQCATLLASGPFDPELIALQEILLRTLKKPHEEQRIDSKLVVNGMPVVSRQLAVAVKEKEYKEYAAAEKHTAAALQVYPKSTVGNVVWAELMMSAGTSENAIAALAKLNRQFPEEPYFQHKRIEVEARRGMYGQGLALLQQEQEDGENLQPVQRPAAGDNTEDLLTQARLLWGDKQQEKALEIYQQLLEPPVQDLLGEKFNQKQINYRYLTRENTFWNSMMLLLRSEPDVVAGLMAPQFLLDNRHNEAGEIVTELFEKYSWQKLIAGEYTARKAIFERNYYYAEQSYQKLKKEASPEAMSDLAAIYGKIGKYRKEAQVYEEMQKSGTTSPELEKSIARNTLQISPQSVITAEHEERSGRDGHIDVGRTTVGTSFWFTPALNKDIQLLYANNQFEALDGDGATGSNYLYAVATYEFSKAYELILGGGGEKISGNSSPSFLYQVQLRGQLDDYVNAYALLEKRQVYDTIEAIEQQITYQAFETGLSAETPIGLSFGVDLRQQYYNDGNGERRFHGYTSYSIFGESLQAALRYDYQYLTNDDGNKGPADSEELSDAPYYWSPSFFTEHRFNVHFQHDFLGFQQGTKKSMSYYAIDTAIGLEDNENVSFTTSFNIFLEMSPHFLLKSNFTLSRSDDFEEKGLFMSLHYRW